MTYVVRDLYGIGGGNDFWPSLEFRSDRIEVLLAADPILRGELFYASLGLVGLRQGPIEIDGSRVRPPEGRRPSPPHQVAVVDPRSVPPPGASIREFVAGDRKMTDEDVGSFLHAAGVQASVPTVRELRPLLARSSNAGNAGVLPSEIEWTRQLERRHAEARKRLELARAFASGKPWVFLLDASESAGEPPLVDLLDSILELRELAARSSAPPGVVLFAPPPAPDTQDVLRGLRVRHATPGGGRPAFEEGLPAPRQAPRPEAARVLGVRGLCYRHPGSDRWTLWDIAFELFQETNLVVLGTSGLGKSTILRVLAGLVREDAGEFDPPRPDWPRIGLVFQNGALFSSLSALQNVTTVLVEAFGHSSRDARRLAVSILEDLGLAPPHFDKPIPALSAGQRKLVAIARSMALGTRILLYDEPSSGLDPEASRNLDDIIRTRTRVGDAVCSMVVTHQIESALDIADDVFVLAAGDEDRRRYWIGAQKIARGPAGAIRRSTHPALLAFLGPHAAFAAEPLARVEHWYD